MTQEDQHKQDLVDSLLQSMYETDKEKAKSLVVSGMERIDDSSVARSKSRSAPLPSADKTFLGSTFLGKAFFGSGIRQNSPVLKKLPSNFLQLALAMSVSALLLVAVALPIFDNSRSADAAVKLSLKQAFQDVGRHYRATAVWRLPENQPQVGEAELFVKGGDKFAVRFEGLQNLNPFWFGSNEHRSWVVPPVGPVLEGNRRHLTGWFDQREDISTPYLHVATALERMTQLYDLQTLPGEDLILNGNTHRCQRVAGSLMGDAAIISPDRIDLWLDAKTGVAMKIVASWELAEGQFGRESATILFLKEVELSDDFFTSESHGGEGRHRIDFSTEKKN